MGKKTVSELKNYREFEGGILQHTAKDIFPHRVAVALLVSHFVDECSHDYSMCLKPWYDVDITVSAALPTWCYSTKVTNPPPPEVYKHQSPRHWHNQKTPEYSLLGQGSAVRVSQGPLVTCNIKRCFNLLGVRLIHKTVLLFPVTLQCKSQHV